MPFSAYITRSSNREGGFSRSLAVERPENVTGNYTAVRHAAELLTGVESGVPTMQGRTFHVSTCKVEHDPRRVDTGWKAFDAQANRSGGFMTGNVDSDVQNSNFVRAYNNLCCNGFPFPAGQLRDSDLARFRRTQFRESSFDLVDRRLRSPELVNRELVLYLVSHSDSAGMRKVHGWAATTPEGELLFSHRVATSLRSLVVMHRAIEAFTINHVPGSEKPLLRIDAGVVTLVDSEVRDLVDSLVVADGESATPLRPRQRT